MRNKSTQDSLLNGKKILYIDDDSINCLAVRVLCQREYEMQFDIATDPYTGIEKALKNTYDIIIIDIGLPVMNGFEVVKELEKENITCIIFYVSACSGEWIKECSEKYNLKVPVKSNNMLSKPFKREELLEKLEDLLKMQ